jgi:hypothetical protein
MITQGDIFLIVVISALSLFAGVLGFASWEETQSRRGRR